jgi:hypothetical protein
MISTGVIVFLLLSAGALAAQAPPARVLEIDAAFRRMAERSLWPGFQPLTTPRAIFDGEATWLFGHPGAPDGFDDGSDGVRRYPGRHPLVTANSSVLLDRVRTATVLADRAQVAARDVARTLVHEAFHVYATAQHADWTANEAALFEYPLDDPDALAARRMESEALRRALAAEGVRAQACWSAVALAGRTARFARLPAAAAEYERFSELSEGLAEYVERRATGDTLDVIPGNGYSPAAIRDRAYATGAALALVLDRLRPGWPGVLNAKTHPLDALLAQAVQAEEAASCGLETAARDSIAARARRDVSRLAVERNEQLAQFENQPGWRLVLVNEGPPLFPSNFDPLNVHGMGGGRVLHTRVLGIANERGSIEVFGRTALTEAAGAHPLFNGVRRLIVTGLAEPDVDESAGMIRVSAEGVRAEFRGATVVRGDRSIEIRIAPG